MKSPIESHSLPMSKPQFKAFLNGVCSVLYKKRAVRTKNWLFLYWGHCTAYTSISHYMSLYIRIPDPYEATSLLGMSRGFRVLNAVQLHPAIFLNCIMMLPQHNGMNQTLNEPAKSCNSPNVALGFPGLSMAPSITAQHARVRQCHSGCVLVGRSGCWVWSLNEKTEI